MAKKYIVTVNGTSYEVVVEDADPNATYTKAPEPAQEAPKAAPAASGSGETVSSPMQPPATGKRSPRRCRVPSSRFWPSRALPSRAATCSASSKR